MKVRLLAVSMVAAGLSPLLFSADTASSKSGSAPAWNHQAADAYLDARLTWWSQWSNSARDHGTFCVSCHTVAPQAMARLISGAKAPSEIEGKLISNVTTRVRLWDEVAPYYGDNRGPGKGAESRGTEAVLNALVLASYNPSRGEMNPDLRSALDHMWAAQLKSGDAKGAWNWLQFHNAPWEGDSQYYGATLAALVAGSTPASYRSSPDVQEGFQSLQEYLKKNYASQKLFERVMVLWASTELPGLLSESERKAIVADALAKQQADGGFSTTDFVAPWTRADKTALETKSDGYATGLVALVFEAAGISPQRAELKSALDWLAKNQQAADGRWLAYSLNKNRDLSSDAGKFMSDAATAYAVTALVRANR